jgi:hypothetical protein
LQKKQLLVKKYLSFAKSFIAAKITVNETYSLRNLLQKIEMPNKWQQHILEIQEAGV